MASMTFDVSSAKKVIARLEAEGIAFSITDMDPGVTDMPVAPLPTKFGWGAKVTIRVAQQDDEAFNSIHHEIMTMTEDLEDVGQVRHTGLIMSIQKWLKMLFGI